MGNFFRIQREKKTYDFSFLYVTKLPFNLKAVDIFQIWKKSDHIPTLIKIIAKLISK